MDHKNIRNAKVGKNIPTRKLGLVELDTYVPDSITFKSVQLRLKGWIVPNREAEQQDYNRVMSLTKIRLKQMIREWTESYRFYQPECIIDIDTGDVNRHTRKKPHQFFKVDIVLYVRPDLLYDSYFVTHTTYDLAERSIEILDQFPDYWNFIIKKSKRK